MGTNIVCFQNKCRQLLIGAIPQMLLRSPATKDSKQFDQSVEEGV